MNIPFLGFSEFHSRREFTADSGQIDFDRDPDSISSLMQSWLYFGLLSEFLEYPVPFDDFLQDRGLVDSSILEDLISDWERRLSPLAQAQPKAANP
jgi:hypothetical protein